ncbi:MAG: sigma-70 family RNA polymerase sigma factor [bacterium]|nr:sigma-70 family RNA polymerase sigma factor [bacterium]
MTTAKQARSDGASDPIEWVDRHGDALYRYALLRLRDAGAAEDLVQECFAAALAGREQFAGRASERTWLIGILKRKVIDRVRRQARERRTDEGESAGAGEEAFFTTGGKWKVNPARWGGDPAGHLVDREFWGVFRGCLGDLPAPLAETFLLRELDQIGSEEVCEVLGLSATNLWTRLHRARLALRACLEAHGFGRKQS